MTRSSDTLVDIADKALELATKIIDFINTQNGKYSVVDIMLALGVVSHQVLDVPETEKE